MFVRLDDGPRPFDDILQAQRAGMVQQQQGFENALSAEQFKVRRDQGQQELNIAEQRTNVLRRDAAGRTVSRALKTAETFGRKMTPSRESFSEMFGAVAKSNPDGLAQAMQPFANTEFDDDMLSTPEGAAAFEAMSGLWLAEEGKKSGEAANRVMLGAQALMADPRAGLTDKDLEPLMGLVEEGMAPREQIEAQWSSLRSKAAKNIGTAEMKRVVLAEAEGAWQQAIASMRGGKGGIPDADGNTDLDKLAELRGAIETASTPEELNKARGQYLVKAYQLDGVISEAEGAAFAAGQTAASAMFQQAFGGAMGNAAAQAAPQSQGAAAGPQGGARLDPAKHPNLTKAVTKATGEDPLVARQRAALTKKGYVSAPEPGSDDEADAKATLDDEERRYTKDLESAYDEIRGGSDPSRIAKARNVDPAPLVEFAAQRASDDRFRQAVERSWTKVEKAIKGAASGPDKRSAVIAAGAAKTREEAERMIQTVETPLTAEERQKLARFRFRSSSDQQVAEWTGIPVRKVTRHFKDVGARETTDQTRIAGERAMKGREDARQSRVAAGFKDRDSLVQAVAEEMIDLGEGDVQTVSEVFAEKHGVTLDRSEIAEARKLRAKLVKERADAVDTKSAAGRAVKRATGQAAEIGAKMTTGRVRPVPDGYREGQ